MYEQNKEKNIINVQWDGLPYESPINFVGKKISIMGYSEQDIIDNPSILLDWRSDIERARLNKACEGFTSGEEFDYESTYRAVTKQGSVVLITEISRCVKDYNGIIRGETLYIDTALGKELGEKLQKLSDNVMFSEADQILLNEIELTVIDEIVDTKGMVEYIQLFCETHSLAGALVCALAPSKYSIEGKKNIISDLTEKCKGEMRFRELIQETFNKAEERKENSYVENKAIGIYLSGCPLVVAGSVKAVVILACNMDEFQTSLLKFEKATKMLAYLTEKLSLALTNSVNFYVESIKRDEVKNLVQYGERKNETFARVIQLLESDLEFEKIVFLMLEIIGEFLGLSNAILTKINKESPFEVVCEWKREDALSYSEYVATTHIEDVSQIENSIEIISPGEDKEKFQKFMAYGNAEALVSVPIIINSHPEMFATFIDDSFERKWDVETINFLADVCRMLQSIIYKRISQNSLASSYSALREILNNIGSGIYVVNKQTKKILFCNDLFKRLAGGDMVDRHCWDYHYGGFSKECEHCKTLGKSSNFFELYIEDKDEWYEVTNNDITWIDGKRVSLCVITDITEKKKYQKKIEFQANNDYLTGLFNRMKAEEDLARTVKQAEKTGQCGAVMFIDLDDFKHINDGLGHQYGDILLRMVSNGLKQIEGVEENCYRLGGDEFLIIVHPEHYRRLDVILDEVLTMFSKPWYLNDTEYYCTMSMGVVRFPKDGITVSDLIKKADIAMYDAKNAGKNRFKFYNSGEEKQNFERLDIEKNMRLAVALGCDEFELYLQPIFDVMSGKCVGGEALLRWNSINLGFLMPNEFIPLAEHLGLIVQIGEHVLERACEINKRWSERGIEKKINVNLSVIQLMQNDVVDTIQRIIVGTGVNPQNLVLEVTENFAITDMNRMIKIINDIRALGVRIALDDFGTGYSSLNYVKQMNFDTIKVDKAFVRDIHTDTYSRSFIKLISELSKELNINLCVEGVETRKQLHLLKNMNIELAQGFYFGKPVPLQKFEKKYL